MKRYIYIMMAMLAGAFASCSKEDTSQSPGTEGTQSVTINLVADDAVNTRAAATELSQYIIEVYSDAAYTIPENIFGEGATATNQATSANGSFSLILDRTREYHCLFWADKDAEAYTTATLKTVTLAPGKTPAEAWSGTKQISGSEPTQTITLKRAVAKLNLLETGKLIAGTTLTATFDQPTVFNVATGEVTSALATRTETITLENAMSGSKDSPVQLGADYFILSPTSTQYVVKVTFKCGEEEAFDVDNVPFQANCATNIKGHYTSLASETFNVTCDDDWNTTDNDVDLDLDPTIWDGTITAQPAGYVANSPGEVNITSAAELAWLSSQSQSRSFDGYTFNLTTDINLNNHEWTPIGRSGSSFKGTFNGQSHTVSNLKCTNSQYAGLFGDLSGATVKNVTVSGSISYVSQYTCYLGGIAGSALNSSISGCINQCTITVTDNTASGYVGGIVGNMLGCILSDNINTGNVSTNTNGNSAAGGIIGRTNASSGSDNTILTNNTYSGGTPNNICIGICSITNGTITIDNVPATNGQPYPLPTPN